MLEKINNYKGVIIFYILLALILLAVSYHNKQVDVRMQANNYILEY